VLPILKLSLAFQNKKMESFPFRPSCFQPFIYFPTKIANPSLQKRGVKDDGLDAINGLPFTVCTTLIVNNRHQQQQGISLSRTAA
jgi:hypothetical protein